MMDFTSLLSQLTQAQDLEQLEQAFEQALGKKGWLPSQFARLKLLSPEEKKVFGAELSQAKEQLSIAYQERLDVLKTAYINTQLEHDIVDITTPAPSSHK